MAQMSEGKKVGERIAGYSKSERADAKFFLLAGAPHVLALASDQFGWSRGLLWHAWLWLSVLWSIVILGVLFAAYWRATSKIFRRYPKR